MRQFYRNILPKNSKSSDPLRVTTPNEVTFHLEEYKALKAEIAELVQQTAGHISLAATGGGAIMAWLLTNRSNISGFPIAWYLPFAVSAMLGILSLVAYLRITTKGIYLEMIERALGNQHLGWERFFGSAAPAMFWASFFTWGVIELTFLSFAIAMN